MTDAVKMAIEALRPFKLLAELARRSEPGASEMINVNIVRKCAEASAALKQAGEPVAVTELDDRNECMVCTGCGTTKTIAFIKASSPTAFTCCPERKMIPVRDAIKPMEAGWIVSNGNGDRWRTWKRGWSEWTAMRDHATRYARREDAEAVHGEDEDAWRVEPYAPLPTLKRLGQEFDAGEAKAYLYERGDSSFFEREMKPAEFYPNWKITPLYDHPPQSRAPAHPVADAGGVAEDDVIGLINIVTDLAEVDALDKAYPEVWGRLDAMVNHAVAAATAAKDAEIARVMRVIDVFRRHYELNDCEGRTGNIEIPVSALRAAASLSSALSEAREAGE